MGCVSSSQIAFFVPEREGVYRLQWINSTGAAAHIGTHALAAPSEPDLAKSAVKVQIVPGAGFYHEVSCIAGVKNSLYRRGSSPVPGPSPAFVSSYRTESYSSPSRPADRNSALMESKIN